MGMREREKRKEREKKKNEKRNKRVADARWLLSASLGPPKVARLAVI